MSVISLASGNELGRVKELVIDYENGNFLGLVTKGEGLMSGQRIVRREEINRFGEDAVMVKDDGSAEFLEKTGRIRDILDSQVKIKGNRVLTQSGNRLGKVGDLEIDLDQDKLSRIFVGGNLFRPPLIISSNQIISMGKDAIIVKDEVIKVKEVSKVPEMAGV